MHSLALSAILVPACREIYRSVEMEEKTMMIMTQMLELEKNKIEREKRYMEWHRMKVENEFLNEHLDYMLKCEEIGFDSKLEISRTLEMQEKSMLVKNQILELEKNKIEHEKRFLEFHRMKVENVFLKHAIEHLDYMLKCQEHGFGSKLYTESHMLKMENEFFKLENERLAYMLNCQKRGFACKL